LFHADPLFFKHQSSSLDADDPKPQTQTVEAWKLMVRENISDKNKFIMV
jgi:hypothetical protein